MSNLVVLVVAVPLMWIGYSLMVIRRHIETYIPTTSMDKDGR